MKNNPEYLICPKCKRIFDYEDDLTFCSFCDDVSDERINLENHNPETRSTPMNIEIKEHLLKRLNELSGITKRSPEDIINAYLSDLLSEEGNQGSDERIMAKDYFLRGSIAAYGGHEGHERVKQYLDELCSP